MEKYKSKRGDEGSMVDMREDMIRRALTCKHCISVEMTPEGDAYTKCMLHPTKYRFVLVVEKSIHFRNRYITVCAECEEYVETVS